ncbi:MAG: hypothetical protein NTV43_17115 [Methylococcales bacterium]|nr:hypothetical protein [Methylococcales bacterium]
MRLQDQVIAEIKAIPPEKMGDVYKLIHEFRLRLSTPKSKNYKTVDEVFGRLYKTEQKAVSVEEMDLALTGRKRRLFPPKLK